MSSLGPEWARGSDGVRTRDAARVVVLDEVGRVLLLRGSDPARAGTDWWFTVGGGLEPGESARAAAVRELREETGLLVESSQLQGPAWVRTAEFSFLGEACRQHEEFFVLRVAANSGAEEVGLDRFGWTELEWESLSEVRWWVPADLASSGTEFYPPKLVALLADLPQVWTGEPRSID
ncbi:MAG: NUDIX hydrolase [Janthinobacterium lividum]